MTLIKESFNTLPDSSQTKKLDKFTNVIVSLIDQVVYSGVNVQIYK